ncbi:MAG: 3-phosphoshikimate 1-carboxyvinyltransferase [Verrucomicrobia bacterium]|nr:3-phosphoshikimate 1-carboxyvinyltransferase [Verrucomicrobiota bacterium]
MSLPNLIEIEPLQAPVQAEITVPGSKSITNRALILAALANGKVILHGALWSEDTQAMTDCLQKLGFEIFVEEDPEEFCNRTITVQGLGGKIPNAGTAAKPLELFVGNAGTAARFLSALVCLGEGVFRLSGISRMHERPQEGLFKALRELGYRVESEQGNDKLPVLISGGSQANEAQSSERPARSCTVSIEQSSQFASALLLSAPAGNWSVKITGNNADESPYVAMTAELVKAFPANGGDFQIEPDASSGSYFWAADRVVPETYKAPDALTVASEAAGVDSSYVSVGQWPQTGWQADQHFPVVLLRTPSLYFDPKQFKALAVFSDDNTPAVLDETATISREHDLGDSIMTAIAMAPFGAKPVQFTDLGRLRVQECERVVALRTELTKCGAKVVEEGDTLTVYPSELHGAEIDTYNDHRIAMCFAILGLKVPGIKIKNPACVKKTFPNFFQKLAAQPPHGLGVKIYDPIRDPEKKHPLPHEELFAD